MAVLSCPAHGPAAVPAMSTQLPYGRISWKVSLGLGSLEVGGVPSSPFLAPIRVVTTQKDPPLGMSQFPGTPSALHVPEERGRHSWVAGPSGSEQGRGPSTGSALPVNTQGSWTCAGSPRPKCTHRSTPQEILITGTNSPQEHTQRLTPSAQVRVMPGAFQFSLQGGTWAPPLSGLNLAFLPPKMGLFPISQGFEDSHMPAPSK